MFRKFENEIHIINMAVKSAMQGKGYGKLLLKSFLDQLPTKSSVFWKSNTLISPPLIFIVVLDLKILVLGLIIIAMAVMPW